MPSAEALLAVLAAFGVSLVPLLELRFGIPIGLGMDGPPAAVIPAAVLGNVLQLFLVFPAIRWAHAYGQRSPRLKEWLKRIEAGASKQRHWIVRYGWLGLLLFVVVPLPGTGIWSAAIIGRLLRLPERTVWFGLVSGITVSGALYGLGSWGAYSAVEKLLGW